MKFKILCGFLFLLLACDMAAERLCAADDIARIVSLNPSATEIIHALGADDRIVGITEYCPVKELYKNAKSIGTVLGPDIEKIISLKPDIVFTTIEGNRQASIDTLQKLGINVIVLQEINNFQDLYSRIFMMGGLLKCEEASSAVINSMKSELSEIKKVFDGAPPKVFMQLGADPVVTINKDTIINEMIEIAGGDNIAKNESLRYPRYSREKVLSENPDVIIIASMGKFSRKAKKGWQKYKALKAAKNKRIHIIDTELVCHMAPRLVEGAKKIAGFINE